MARRKPGQGFPGVCGAGSGAAEARGPRCRLLPRAPAPEEPQLVRNVNKAETALAGQRPYASSRRKHSYPATPPERENKPGLCTHWLIITRPYRRRGRRAGSGRRAWREAQLQTLRVRGYGTRCSGQFSRSRPARGTQRGPGALLQNPRGLDFRSGPRLLGAPGGSARMRQPAHTKWVWAHSLSELSSP